MARRYLLHNGTMVGTGSTRLDPSFLPPRRDEHAMHKSENLSLHFGPFLQMEPIQGPRHLAALQRKVGLAVIALEVILAALQHNPKQSKL